MDDLTKFVKWERQAELEAEMRGRGIDRFHAFINRAQAEGRMSEVPAGILLLRDALVPTCEGITGYVKDCIENGSGRNAEVLAPMAMLDAMTLAYLTAKYAIDGITRSHPLTNLAAAIGKAVEDEVNMRRFEEKSKRLYRAIVDDLDKRTANRRFKRIVLKLKAKRNGTDIADWGSNLRITLGIRLVEIFRDHTGLIRLEYVQRGKEEIVLVNATEGLLDYIEKQNARCELLTPEYLPTIIPPKPWRGPMGGGYWTDNVRRLPLVKARRKAYIEELRNVPMPEVYTAINALQATAWKINAPVLAALKRVWENGQAVGKLPHRSDIELPAKPADIATNEEARLAWRRHAAEVHRRNNKLRSKRLMVAKTLTMAERFEGEGEFYYPYQLDFRGRVYAVPSYLNPQSADFAKALLMFANGKPIGDGTGPGWLAIHGANLWGEDKVSLEDRIAWVERNQRDILASADDPLGHQWWTEADKPWQFLAFCYEWAGYVEQGAAFVTHLPIALDGSCNGLQHFSAMLRDPVGGAAVNLVPSDKPQDIYGIVAERVVEKLKASDAPEAALWLQRGIDRKTTKRPVMIVPYGGTIMGCRGYIERWFEEKLSANGDGDYSKAISTEHRAEVTLLTKLVWASIDETVLAARAAMDWLQKMARLAAREGLPINWTTPSGFPVLQAYKAMKSAQIETTLDGKRFDPRVDQETDAIDRHRQVTGLPPNFVHSMDAAALVLCVCLSLDNGVQSFAMIHDSYGTLAPDTDMLGACLRRAFVDMYKADDWLVRFRDSVVPMLSEEAQAEVPPLPPSGSLDIEAVLGSDFFFA